MAELRLATPVVVVVLASSEACDRVVAPEDAIAIRTAPREVLLVGPTDLEAVRGVLHEPSAIVDDVTDGWVGFVLEGDDVRDAFARVCELELPDEGWTQGEVARAAAKVIVQPGEPGRLTILVPAMLGSHVEARIRADAAELLVP